MQKSRAGNFDTKQKPAVQRRIELEVKDMAAICKYINKKKKCCNQLWKSQSIQSQKFIHKHNW